MAINWGNVLSGAASGASAGATIGSTVPGIGTGVGAIGGGLAGGLTGLFNRRKKRRKVSSFDPNQREINQQQFQGIQGQGPLAELYNYDPQAANAVFDNTYAKQAYRNLNENTIPSVTGQFRSQGLMDSSYAGDAISKLARDVQEGLDSQRTQFLYNEQKDATTARRNAVENFQNRNTFDYDTSASSDINKILKSLSPELIEELGKLLKK